MPIFTQVKRLVTTARGGPPISDVHRRTVWSLSRGKVTDDWNVDEVPDEILNRRLEQIDDIRVELVTKGAEACIAVRVLTLLSLILNRGLRRRRRRTAKTVLS